MQLDLPFNFTYQAFASKCLSPIKALQEKIEPKAEAKESGPIQGFSLVKGILFLQLLLAQGTRRLPRLIHLSFPFRI